MRKESKIVSGRQFELKSVLSQGFEWRLPGITRLSKMSIEYQIERVKKSAEFLHKNNRPDILRELNDKCSKYVAEKEIEAGFNLFQ